MRRILLLMLAVGFASIVVAPLPAAMKTPAKIERGTLAAIPRSDDNAARKSRQFKGKIKRLGLTR